MANIKCLKSNYQSLNTEWYTSKMYARYIGLARKIVCTINNQSKKITHDTWSYVIYIGSLSMSLHQVP